MNATIKQLQTRAVAFSESFDFWRFVDTYWPQLLMWTAGLGMVYLVVRMVGKKRRAAKQRAALSEPQVSPRSKKEMLDGGRNGLFGWLTPVLAAQIPESKQETSDFQLLLRQAGIYSPAAAASLYALRFLLLFGTLVMTGVVVLLLPVAYMWPVLAVGILLAGFLSTVPRLFVFFRRRSRMVDIRNGLADMMDMLSMCLGGGMPLSPSLDHVSQNLTGHPALAHELQILKRQSEIGSLKQALADFARRIDLPEARQVANLLKRGEQLGTQMTGALLEQADHFRNTRRQHATMAANKTPFKLTMPILLCFAPAALILMVAPAILELHNFFVPQDGQGVMAGEGMLNSPTQIVRTLDDLDQSGAINEYQNTPISTQNRYAPPRPTISNIGQSPAPFVGSDSRYRNRGGR